MKSFEITWKNERWFVEAVVTGRRVKVYSLRRPGALQPETFAGTGSEEEMNPIKGKLASAAHEPSPSMVACAPGITDADRRELFDAIRRAAR